jgi:hypothetical protein
MLQPLYPLQKSPHNPFDRRLGGHQSWSGCYGEEKNIFYPCKESNFNSSVVHGSKF